jgi:hypothetical protein
MRLTPMLMQHVTSENDVCEGKQERTGVWNTGFFYLQKWNLLVWDHMSLRFRYSGHFTNQSTNTDHYGQYDYTRWELLIGSEVDYEWRTEQQNCNLQIKCRFARLKGKNKNSVTWVRYRTIPTERPPLVGEITTNFLRIEGTAWSAWRIPTTVISVFYTWAANFLPSSSSIVLTRLSGPRSRPTSSQ